MQWNLRLAAASRGIWKANELRRLLAEHGLVISTGKMSALWSARPVSVKLADLDVICAVLGCGAGELLVPETNVAQNTRQSSAVADGGAYASVTRLPVCERSERHRAQH